MLTSVHKCLSLTLYISKLHSPVRARDDRVDNGIVALHRNARLRSETPHAAVDGAGAQSGLVRLASQGFGASLINQKATPIRHKHAKRRDRELGGNARK